jgi:hypothetical protein
VVLMACSTCNCNEGRECSGSLAASRAALGLAPMAPLHTRDGGTYFHNGRAWPIEHDTPPESAEVVTSRAMACILFAIVVITCALFGVLMIPL